MPNVPVRGLSKYGIITDVPAYNLPTEAWSFGVNVRFRNGAVERAPVFRNVQALAGVDPRYVSATTPVAGFSSVIVGYLNGRVADIASGTETDISIAGYVDTPAEAAFTICHLGGVFYVNRSDRIPWSQRSSDAIMQPLANWDPTWRANLLRASGGALCAFGITKAGVTYPTMVKTSEFALADTVPSSWDETDPTTNATENILAEMESPITDAQPLGENMIVYGLEEAWLMTADGSDEVWSYHKLYDGYGAINANCAVEVDKKHYVFGLKDIWVHDGVSMPVSICDNRVRNFIFSSMQMGKTNRCYVSYDPALKEVRFNYVSGDRGVSFNGGAEGCNRAAVYNITENNWTFYDLPYLFGEAQANVDTVATWATTTATWNNVGGTWLDQQSSLKTLTIAVGNSSAADSLTPSLYCFDGAGKDSAIALPVDKNATKGWFLERGGIDLDELGADLKGYKLLSSIYPQALLGADSDPLSFEIGAADYFNQNPVMGPAQTYDGLSLYKLDYNITGRWLFMRISQGSFSDLSLTGFDFELDTLGER